jgi:hypothetical protein
MRHGKHHLYDDEVLNVGLDGRKSPSKERVGAGATVEDYNFDDFD